MKSKIIFTMEENAYCKIEIWYICYSLCWVKNKIFWCNKDLIAHKLVTQNKECIELEENIMIMVFSIYIMSHVWINWWLMLVCGVSGFPYFLSYLCFLSWLNSLPYLFYVFLWIYIFSYWKFMHQFFCICIISDRF